MAELPLKLQATLDRFVTACQADNRIMAAFLGGSVATGAADQYSDLDLFVITTDEDFDDFNAQHAAFIEQLGEPVFLENFELPDMVFFILADGTEGELKVGRQGQLVNSHSGPYKILLDKNGVLTGADFPYRTADPLEQAEKMRRLIYWFWHDVSHFITAMGRGQLWWAQGQLEIIRRSCISLKRLQNDFSDVDIGDEAYFKLEKAVPIDQLSALRETFSPMKAEPMLQAGLEIVRFYKEMALPLAKKYELNYPHGLERVMAGRLENLCNLYK